MENFHLTSKCSVLVHGHLVNSKHVKLWVNVTKDSGKVKKHLSVCKGSYLNSNCTLVTLPKENVSIMEGGQLVYTSRGVVSKYDLEQYVPTSRGFSVCLSEPSHDHELPWLLTLFFIAFFMLFLYFFIKTLLEGDQG